jgi:hypothetical protein
MLLVAMMQSFQSAIIGLINYWRKNFPASARRPSSENTDTVVSRCCVMAGGTSVSGQRNGLQHL